jgi:hypothetical protein
MQVLLTWLIATDIIFSYSQNSSSLRCPISSGVQHIKHQLAGIDLLERAETIIKSCFCEHKVSKDVLRSGSR